MGKILALHILYFISFMTAILYDMTSELFVQIKDDKMPLHANFYSLAVNYFEDIAFSNNLDLIKTASEKYP